MAGGMRAMLLMAAAALAGGLAGCAPAPKLEARWYLVDAAEASDLGVTEGTYVAVINRGKATKIQTLALNGGAPLEPATRSGQAADMPQGRMLVLRVPDKSAQCQIPVELLVKTEGRRDTRVKLGSAMPSALLARWINDCKTLP